MPEPLDRETFLGTVADSVDLQPGEVGEVLEELASHLSDAAAGWREAGYSPEDAERRAIRSMGDPAELGRELGKARHRRRRLLAAVGGAVFSTLWFGLWSWLFLWLFLGTLGIVGALLAGYAIRALGGEYGSIMAGPAASAATVAITTLWLAWLGWVLPARVAGWAGRSVPRVRRPVGLVGFAALSAIVWAFLPLTLDPVLAVGLPLVPFAFLLASQKPSRDLLVFPRISLKAGLAAIFGILIAIAAVGVVTAGPPQEEWAGWEADTAAMGAPESAVPELAMISRSGGSGYSASAKDQQVVERSVQIDDAAQAAAFARLFPTLRLEAWPAAVKDNRLVFGAAPIAATSAQVTPRTEGIELSLALPMERQPATVATLLIGIEPDATRVVLGGPDYPIPTSPWQGTLLDWWFGQR